MSRYTIAGKKPFYKVVVGWDNPLETFFAIVYDTREEDPCAEHRIVIWEGTELRQILSVDALVDLLRPYAEMPQETASKLLNDFGSRKQTQAPIFRNLIEGLSDIMDD